MIELQELRCFLVLAGELHFGRTAQRLFLTQPRISQTIRKLEQSIGAPLFERTSRQVKLTPVGEQLRDRVKPSYEALVGGVDEVRVIARGVDGMLRVGFIGAAANELTRPILRAFAAEHPTIEVEIVEVECLNPIRPLRDGEIDVLFGRLPIQEPDLIIGPMVVTEPRSLAVPVDHPLAFRESISAAEAANEHVLDAGCTIHEILAMVAAGRGVSPMPECMARFFGGPDVRFVPIRDLPWSEVALVWRAAGETERVRAFALAAVQAVREHGGPQAGRGPHAFSSSQPLMA